MASVAVSIIKGKIINSPLTNWLPNTAGRSIGVSNVFRSKLKPDAKYLAIWLNHRSPM